ncbi:FAD-binding oxidoreductase [Acidihalobacter ferrooxydans]|nr:FAD-binding oxidoreductase [Acidihalobacter ferrooxydans]
MHKRVSMDHEVTLLLKELETHDVYRLIVNKPSGFHLEPGRHVKLAIDSPELRERARSFTPVSLNADGVLEFLIKRYPDHPDGMTRHISEIQSGQRLLMSAPRGHIGYKGRGTFVAAGTGITPFLAIIRSLRMQGALAGHRLIFANKSPRDVISEAELRRDFGENAVFLAEHDPSSDFRAGRVDRTLLAETIDDFGETFYVCGPPPFTKSVSHQLEELGANPQSLVA